MMNVEELEEEIKNEKAKLAEDIYGGARVPLFCIKNSN